MDIPDYTEEPFEWYKKMRKESPIIRSGNTIHVFKYTDISEVLSNYHVYSSQFRDLLGGELAEMMNQKTSPSILILDPPIQHPAIPYLSYFQLVWMLFFLFFPYMVLLLQG